MQEQVTLDMIRQAREAMEGIVELTPVVTSARVGKNLYIKSENLQKTGSFKIRGAFNKISLLRGSATAACSDRRTASCRLPVSARSPAFRWRR